jgi:hypothetical protein
MVYQYWQLSVRMDGSSHQIGNNFLMGHRQHHISSGLIIEPTHLRANLVPSFRFFPDLSRVYNWHSDLLPPNGVDLLPHNIFNLGQDALGKGQVGEYSGGELLDISGSN